MGELIYAVELGEVEIVAVLADGSEDVVSVVGPGGYFGEMGPLFGIPRSASARARTDTTVVGYTNRDFRKLTSSGGLTNLASAEDVSHSIP